MENEKHTHNMGDEERANGTPNRLFLRIKGFLHLEHSGDVESLPLYGNLIIKVIGATTLGLLLLFAVREIFK